MTRIESGSGTGNVAKVGTDFRLFTNSVTQPHSLESMQEGDAYNFNTGTTAISAETAIIYLKNNEDKDLIITAFVVGKGAGSYNTTSYASATLIRNPTAGTTVSGATPVANNVNMLFSSSATFTGDVFVGASGETLTDGDDVGIFALPNAQSNNYFNVQIELAKGDTIGIKVEPNLSAGSIDCYAVFVAHLRESH